MFFEETSESVAAHRTVIILHYYEDLTLKQIAEITDTPLSTVKTPLYSALKKLKLILKEEEK